MEHHQLRAYLLKLQDRLNDNDRKRLHFLFGNDVSPQIRDDPSLGGTLSLIESLFDQGKINEQDVSVLITAFNEIQCHNAVRVFQGQMQQLQSKASNEPLPSLPQINSTTFHQLVEDQEDKYSARN
ncbi:unnamed protein product, partial [Rotaria sp. Silwood2]